MSEADIRDAFASQADWNRRLDGPFSALVAEVLGQVIDRSTVVGRRVIDWPGDPRTDAIVLRLLGGLHALVRAGALPDLAHVYPPHSLPDRAALAVRLTRALAEERLLPWLESAPQTNEVARSGVLMPGVMVIAAATGLPLRLFELGASAGLNLRMDRYRYDLGGATAGAPDAPLLVAPDWSGPPPPQTGVTVVARRGVDVRPVDVSRDGAQLIAFVWPEQAERLARLAAAMAAFAADPAQVDASDAAEWVEAHVAVAPGTATVVYHSIAWQYFPAATQRRIEAHMAAQAEQATAAAPLAWLRFELDDATALGPLPTLRLKLWPGGEDRLLARADPHCRGVEWFG